MSVRIAVIGAGASGMLAAIVCARRGADVVLYERCDRVGKKILATGNGRCNYSNADIKISNYHGQNPQFADYALKNFGFLRTKEFFEELGMLTKVEENSKAYPYSLQASSVLDVLRFELERLGVKVVCGFEAAKICKKNNEFTVISYNNERIVADKVILACGGKASPALGSNGSGYELVKSFGHKVTKTFPSLVQVKTDTKYVKALKGIKLDADVTFLADGIKEKTSGEVLFCDYGLSGPAIFNISRLCSEFKNAKIVLDLLPEIDYNNLRELLIKRKASYRNIENFFVGMINKKVGMTVSKYAEVLPYTRSSDSLSDKEINALVSAIKKFTLSVEGTMSWNNAQVTAGGIVTSDVCEKTMESKLCPGLYITGELLDIDGDCGGYNLQWAWSSGYLAGVSASCQKGADK